MQQKADMHNRDPKRGDPSKEELSVAHERLALALSATGLGVWERDLSTHHVTWSDTMYQLFGRTPEQFRGDPDQVLSYVHPEDRAEFRRVYQEAVHKVHDFFEHEFRIVRPDGEVRWVQRRGRVRRGPDGRARSVLGVALDITERKQADEANARLAALVSGADDAIVSLGPDGTIQSWNPAAERLFGYSTDEVVGRSARILYPEGSGAEFEKFYARVRAGEHIRFEGVRIRRGGSPLDVSVAVTPVIGKDGWVVGASAIVRDVTERKVTEQKLVDTLALLLQTNNQRNLALAAGGMGTFEVDVERDVVTWSNEIFTQVGMEPKPGTLKSAVLEQYIHPEDLEQARERRAEAFKTGSVYENEFRIVRPDGKVRWIYVRAQATSPRDGPPRAYGVSMDITERKEREAHIRFLLSEVAHRSKNLLAVVQAIAAQTARTALSASGFADDFGARLKSLASSLDLLVQQEWRGVSVKGLVQSQLGHYAETGKRRVEVEGEDVMLIPLAAQYLGMALHELSTNAVKYGALSAHDGKVLISWQVEDKEDGQHFVMSWREQGGPPVVAPTATGFGTLVIERMAAEATHGTVSLQFPREGVRWFLDAEAASTLKY